MVAVGWWQLVGDNWWVAVGWWQAEGGRRRRRAGYNTKNKTPYVNVGNKGHIIMSYII